MVSQHNFSIVSFPPGSLLQLTLRKGPCRPAGFLRLASDQASEHHVELHESIRNDIVSRHMWSRQNLSHFANHLFGRSEAGQAETDKFNL